MVDPIAESIDAVLGSVGRDDGLTYDTIAPHIDHSAEIQKLIIAHISSFYASENAIPTRIKFAVLHSFWLGFEAGKAVVQSEKMEDMFR